MTAAAGGLRLLGSGDARVGSATVGAAALVAQQVVAKALRDTLFLEAFGVAWLPYAMIAASVLSAGVVLGVSRLSVSRSPRRVARTTLLVSAALFLLAWLLSARSPRAAAAVTYLHAGALGAASVSVFWSLVSESFDPFAARSSVPRIMAGATLGGVAGGLVTWRAAAWMSPADLLPLGAVLNAVTLAAVARLRGAAGRSAARAGPRWRALFREVPYLRALALLVLATAMSQAVLDYLLSSTAVATLGTGRRLLSFFALFQTGVGVLSFLVQIGASRTLLERFGVGATLAVSPSLLVPGVLAALVSPPLVATVLVRGTDGVLGASLHRSAYEVLFAPVEARQRRAAKPLLDVLCDRLGMLLGSALVAVVAAATAGAPRGALLAAVAALAGARLLLSTRLQAGYRHTLADNLRHGALGLSGVGVLDRGTVGSLSRAAGEVGRTALLEQVARFRAEQARSQVADRAGARLAVAAFDVPVGPELEGLESDGPGPAAAGDDHVVGALRELRSGDAARIRAVLAARRTEPLLAAQVARLLDDDRVARDAADWLTAQEPPPIGALADVLLADGLGDGARRRVARLLGKVEDPRAAEALLAALPVAPTGVRPGLAHALARTAARRPLPREPILAAAVRAAAEPPPGDGAAHVEDVFRLLAAAYPGEPVLPALRALGRSGAARGTALEWLDVFLPQDVKLAVWPLIVRSGERVPATPRGADELRRALFGERLARGAGPDGSGA